MDMALEKKVFESFTSTLKLNEDSADEQDCIVALTLGELRQHVQWCQYAAQLVDMAAESNASYTKDKQRLARAERMLKDYEKIDQDIASIAARANNLKGAIDGFNKVRADLTKVRDDAKANN